MNEEKPSIGSIRIRFSGDRAILVEVPTVEHAHGLSGALRSRPELGIVDTIPAMMTVLVIADSSRRLRKIVRYLRSLHQLPLHASFGRAIHIPVVYGGADLHDVAQYMGMSVDAVIQWHSTQTWGAAFAGFTPGFVYLVAEHGVMIPRRETPRTSVPSGSVALASSYSAIYPRSSAGGWQLIGQTAVSLWDEFREDPALLHPGDTVTFLAVQEKITVSNGQPSASIDNRDAKKSADLTVVRPGVLAAFQDLGRQGKGELGVSPSGAMDEVALQSLNKALGNPEDFAAIETFATGFTMTAGTDQIVAVSGAVSQVTLFSDTEQDVVNIEPSGSAPFTLRANQTLSINQTDYGNWSYISVRGGFDVEHILGSSSWDTLAGIGPKPLQAGSQLRVKPPLAPSQVSTRAERVQQHHAAVIVLRVTLGPRHDWFTADTRERFFSDAWLVTHSLNRTATRLSGKPLTRSRDDELHSEGIMRGAVQVPPDGQPLIFGADHPVTGGYPVLAVVIAADFSLAAQMRPGSSVRFRLVDPSDVLTLDPERQMPS